MALARIATERQAALWLLAETALFALAYAWFFQGSLDLKFDEGGFARFRDDADRVRVPRRRARLEADDAA